MGFFSFASFAIRSEEGDNLDTWNGICNYPLEWKYHRHFSAMLQTHRMLIIDHQLGTEQSFAKRMIRMAKIHSVVANVAKNSNNNKTILCRVFC